jgi:hypothetical protein
LYLFANKQTSPSIQTTTNNSGVSSVRSIFGGEKAGNFGLHVCQIRTPASFLLAANFEGEIIH